MHPKADNCKTIETLFMECEFGDPRELSVSLNSGISGIWKGLNLIIFLSLIFLTCNMIIMLNLIMF